ncbi:hypothetical protein FRC02_007328 [Tulasnella sp. 418]|nr:hypothetical protein FRC02_007328 [Tulasnella sp. 418]
MRSVSKQLAHTAILPLGNQDLKPLQDIITADKYLLTSFQRVSQDFGKSAEALKFWGAGEGDDLGDILSHSCNILQLLVGALNQFAIHEETIRTLLKAVRTREENLDELRRRRRNVGSKADSAEKKLSKMGMENKHRQMQVDLMNQLKEEMRALDTEIMIEEARIGDYKRHTAKEWMSVKYGAVLELGQKLIIVGEQGKTLIEGIPMELTTPGYGRAPYMNHERAARITSDTIAKVNEIVFQPTPNVAYDPRTGYPPTNHESNQSQPAQFNPPAPIQQHYTGLPELQQPTAHQDTLPSDDRNYIAQPQPQHAYNPYNEFGLTDPPPNQHGLAAPATIGSGFSFPPRTSSFRSDSIGTTQDPSASRFATFPNHSRETNNATDTPSSQFYHPTLSPHINQSSEALPSPAVPPKDNQFDPRDTYTAPKPADGPSSERAAVTESNRPSLDPNRTLSTFDDSDASLVLAYYHAQGEDTTSPVSTTHKTPQQRDDVFDEDPYADDAFHGGYPTQAQTLVTSGPAVSAQPHASILPYQSKSPEEETRAANAAAAREISRELDALEFNVATGGINHPPPRTTSRKATLPTQTYSPPRGPPPTQSSISNPPLLSLSLSDTHFDTNDFPNFGSSPIRSNPPAYQATFTSSLSSPPRMQKSATESEIKPLSSPPRLEEPENRKVPTAVFDPNVVPQKSLEHGSPSSRKIPTAVFDPEVIPSPPQQSDNTPNRMPSTISVSESGHSGESQLSVLPPPNPPFMNTTQVPSVSTSMPSSPTSDDTGSGDGLTPRMISASAFRRVKGPSSGAIPGESSTTKATRFEPLNITKRVPPPTMPSYGSGSTTYVSAPSSPSRERSYSDAPSSPTGAYPRPTPFAPSPLSTPMNPQSVDSHEASSLGNHGQQSLPMPAFREPPPESHPSRELDPAEIGLAKGSPSSPSYPMDSYRGYSNAGPNRLTIGDQGWKPLHGTGPIGRNVGQGDEVYQHQRGAEQKRDGGSQDEGYGSGRFATNLE